MSNTTTQSTAISTVETPDLIVDHGRPKATSLQVAAYFGKRHDDVLRSIKRLEIPDDYRLRNFAETITYRDNPKGEGKIESPMVEMTRDGFAILAMGFTGKEAMRWKIAFLEEFKRLEQLAAEGLKLEAQKALQSAQLENQLIHVPAKEKQRHIEAGLATIDRIKKEPDLHKRELLHSSLKHLYVVYSARLPALDEMVPALPAPKASGPTRDELADRVEDLENLRDTLLEALRALERSASIHLINDDGGGDSPHPVLAQAKKAMIRAQRDQKGGAQ